MLFTNISFLLLFLPLVLVATLKAPAGWRSAVLIVASLAFYAFSGVEHMAALVACVGWVHLWSRQAAFTGSRWRLAVAVMVPLAALIYFKYTGFLGANLAALFGPFGGGLDALIHHGILPAGISFFTFHLVGYAIDRFTGRLEAQKASRLLLFIAFFPHLVAGPILRFQQVAAGLEGLRRWRLDWETARVAAGYAMAGFAAKVLLADTLAVEVDVLAAHPAQLSVEQALFVVLGYTFQIYFDFYGYSLMAIGLAKLFGFDFPANFDRPYSALNPRDFWRRWHMTLSFWLRDYLYMPLGGNHAYVRNILIVFAACGLWHGAGWNFVLWGLYHAALVLSYHGLRRPWDRMPAALQWGVTFAAVALGWLCFRFDMAQLGQFAAAAWSNLPGLDVSRLPPLAGDRRPMGEVGRWLIVATCAWVCFAVRFEALATRPLVTRRAALVWGAGLGGVVAVALTFLDRSQVFIYFRF